MWRFAEFLVVWDMSAIKLVGEKAPESVRYLTRAKNLYQLLAGLYMNGVGARVMPSGWRTSLDRRRNYYLITHVKLKVE